MAQQSQSTSKENPKAIMHNETTRKLVLLQTKREYGFRDMQILIDLSKDIFSDKSALTKFKARFKRIEQLRNEFLEYNSQINELKLIINPSDTIDLKVVHAFDDLYYTVVGTADSVLADERDRAETSRVFDDASARYSADSLQNSAKPFSQVRLPSLELPKFGGEIEQWQTFFDTFSSLVHENRSISLIEKFHYLLSCLSGPALSIAKGVPVTADNYQIVFDALIERFENKRILACNYLDKISNCPQIKTSNFAELRNLTNILNETVNALKAMKIKQLDEFILFYLASRILDSDTRKRFEIQNREPIPTFSELLTFLQGYIKVLEVSQSGNGSGIQMKLTNKSFVRAEGRPRIYDNNYKSASLPASRSMNVSMSNQRSMSCIYCGETHTIFKCSKFQQLSIPDKYKTVSTRNLCCNCLRPNHNVDQCFSKSSCSVCGQRHHSLLHSDGSTVAIPTVGEVFDNSEEVSEMEPPLMNETSSTTTSTHVGHSRACVLLGTCVVRVCRDGDTSPAEPIFARALIDSGAQDCFMTSSFAQRMRLPLRRCNLTVAGLGTNVVHQVKGEAACTILTRDSDDPQFHINAIVMDKITSKMPLVEIPSTVRKNLKHLILADPQFDKPADIDLLLGAEQFHSIYDGQRLHLGNGLPVALHSIFGWVVTGKVQPVCPPATISSLVASTYSLENIVRKFWEVEEPPKIALCDPEDEACENLYTSLVSRKPDGRYVVPLLLKESQICLGDSLTNAKSRLNKLEKRFERDSELGKEYSAFMSEYQSLGHMQPSSLGSGKFVIPHHCVIRPNSTTTRLRVVFDASSKSTNGKSLNDIVLTGPKLQNDIVDIITKFRLQAIVFTADITKMYRNIELRPQDREWQHVLWRSSPSDQMCEYELNTVTYGVTSSPFLAIRTLHQLADDHNSEYPKAAKIIREDTFMDDITAGAATFTQAIQLKEELVSLLKCAQFELRKWSSNSPEFNASIPEEHCQVPKTFCDENHQHIIKILGVQWNPHEDFFTYSISNLKLTFTKRAILSCIARIYDPVGWLAPVVLVAKLILQELWRLNVGWVETVPAEIAHKWKVFVKDIQCLQNIRVPRRITANNASCYELIGFCDGSTKGYGCCIYLRSVTRIGYRAHLLVAKSKLAPIKPLTVNRLELCGAVLLARVLKHMFDLLNGKLNISQIIAFTDSSTVLAWLHTEPHRLKTFVAHRVVKVTDEISLEHWRHVSTHDNPADYSSRGLGADQLTNCAMWWSGPEWLVMDLSCWPESRNFDSSFSIPEIRNNYLTQNITSPSSSTDTNFVSQFLERYSSLSRVQRLLAWCLRFVAACKGQRKLNKSLTVEDLDNALFHLVKHEQQCYFSNDIQSSRAVTRLRPFLDKANLLRVGGRLQHSELPVSSKHPLLLPKSSQLSLLIVDYYHIIYLHCGPRTLQSIIQRKFWILGIRNLIRTRLSKCIQCFKAKPIACQPLMGNLPPFRVQQTRVFQKVGIDFAGPFVVKESQRRKSRLYKAYACVFVCLAVKAIHIEVVTELSTQAFIAALDRFVSRRGLCTIIVTDNGTNFIGAKRYLNELHKFILQNYNTIVSNSASRQIMWQLNPPTGSHFGGIFESGVKSMKYHLKRVIGTQVLTLEELITVLTKVEAVLNSRPLCNISSDPSEVDVLTPGHFLVQGPLISLPEPDLVDQYIAPRERWQMLQKLTQSFWRVWHRDYLHTLQQRAKWFQNQTNLQCGDVVLIVENNVPPLEWRLGQVVTLHPGSDGVVRVVTIHTSRGQLRRPVTKLCPLPKTH